MTVARRPNAAGPAVREPASCSTCTSRWRSSGGTEKAAHDLFLAGLVKGTTHLAAGHEAVAVGASAALRPDDYVFATYRGHHHAMARGASPEECLAELMSKAHRACARPRAARCT